MIEEWTIIEPQQPIQYCVLGLPGRGNDNSIMARIIQDCCLPNTLIVSVRPKNYAWYPQPKSAVDQQDAVAGLPAARNACLSVLHKINKGFSVPYDKIAILGYSAGGVIGLQTIVKSNLKVASVVSMCGALLDTKNIPEAKNDTPILLLHNQDDLCFEWNERYLPTKRTLVKKKYNVYCLENKFGGHIINIGDVLSVSKFLGRNFGIKDWCHPKEKEWFSLGIDDNESEN